MRRHRWVAFVPLSAAFHALGLLCLLWFASRVVELPPLFVDLSTLGVDRPRSVARPPPHRRPLRVDGGGAHAAVSERPRGASAPPTRGRARARAALVTGYDRETPPTPAPLPAEAPREIRAAGAVSEDARAMPAPGGAQRVTVQTPAVPRSSESASETPGVRDEPGAREPPPVVPDQRPSVESTASGPIRPAVVSPREAPAASAGEAPARAVVPAPNVGAASAPGGGEAAPAPRTGAGDQARPSAGATGHRGGRRGTGAEQDGSGHGASGPVAAAIGGGSGGAGAEYDRYLAQWRRRIYENLRYPIAARRRSLTGTVQLDIAIEPDGAIHSVRIVASSTHPVLDEAAVEAVRDLPPLPFPSHLAPRPLRARLPVVFDLR